MDELLIELKQVEEKVKEYTEYRDSLKKRIQEQLEEGGKKKASVEGIKVSVCKKVGKKKISEEDQFTLEEMQTTIDAERSEMVYQNKEKIYELEKSIVKSEAELKQLTESVWTKELERKRREFLEEAENRSMESGKTNYYLRVKLSEG